MLRTVQIGREEDTQGGNNPDDFLYDSLHDRVLDAAKNTHFDIDTVRELAKTLQYLLRPDPSLRRKKPDSTIYSAMTTGWVAEELRRHYDPNGILSAATR